MRTRLVFLLTVALLSSRAATGAGGDVTLSVAGRTNLAPWIASDGDFIAVTWGAKTPAGAGDVFVAVSRDAGLSFGSPVQVNTRSGEARLSGETGPRVAIHRKSAAGDPQVVVLWNAKTDGHTEIRSARSVDGGRPFAAPQTLNVAQGKAAFGNGRGASHARCGASLDQPRSDFRRRDLARVRSAGEAMAHGGDHTVRGVTNRAWYPK